MKLSDIDSRSLLHRLEIMIKINLDNDNISEQDRVIVAMGAIACLQVAQSSPEFQELSVKQFVPSRYIANLLNIDVEVVRAALQNAEEMGIASFSPTGE